jgi:CDP-paratose 2-epimerase
MRILITGICGFVGSTLAQAWLESGCGYKIIGIDNLSRRGSHVNHTALRASGIDVLHGDIRCASDLDSLPPVDFLIDAAAIPSVLAGVDGKTNSRQLVEHNLLGTVNMLEYCRRHGAGLILLSTSRVYSLEPLANVRLEVEKGAFQPLIDDSSPPGLSTHGVSEAFTTAAPVSLYGATKLASETMALEYGAAFGFPVWINRCGVMAGPGQFGHAEQGIFAYWIHAWHAGRPLKYVGFGGHGYQVRDALSPRDLLAALDQQMSFSGRPEHRIFNFAGGVENATSLYNLSAWCERRFGPRKVECQDADRPFDVPWMVLDCRRAASTWNWRPALSLETLLGEIADFAEANPNWLDLVDSKL